MIPENFRLIATSAAIVRAFGPAAAIWLGNAISSQDWSMSEHRDPWWWSGKADIEERTGLSPEFQETARKRLREAGILHERRGILARGAQLASIWYWVDFQALAAFFECREGSASNAGLAGNRAPGSPAGDPDASFAASSTHLGPSAISPAKAKRKAAEAFEPPTLEEWTAYMREHYPWVPGSDAFSSFEFYRSGDWTLGNGKKVKSWQRCAATAQGNFLARNPTAKRDYERKTATAARPPQKLLEAAPVADGFPDDPAWTEHLEKELAAGRNKMQAWMSWRSRA